MRLPPYPLYRALANGASRFRIDSSVHFTEVQRIGTRYVIVEVWAKRYPEKVRIAELISARDGAVVEIPPERFQEWLALAGAGPGGPDPQG